MIDRLGHEGTKLLEVAARVARGPSFLHSPLPVVVSATLRWASAQVEARPLVGG
jgi:hypothetical protein